MNNNTSNFEVFKKYTNHLLQNISPSDFKNEEYDT